MEGIYMYRSAMAWLPTCTSPITGTSVPRNHSQPIRKYGRLVRQRQPTTEITTSTPTAMATSRPGR